MPWGDRTGPDGEGPRTGRGAGDCNGNDEPGSARPRCRSRRSREEMIGQGRGRQGRRSRPGGRRSRENW